LAVIISLSFKILVTLESIRIYSLRETIQRITWLTIIVVLSISTNAQFRYSINKAIIKDTVISSKILGKNRKIDIYKPEIFSEYADVLSPVIYVFDGEAYINYFANTINMLCQRFVQMPPIIIVSIENYVDSISNDRERDFKSIDGVDKFMRFVSDEVIPMVEKDYKKSRTE
jgi:predicted alpha/beta superfamily hydrolase